MMYVMLRLGLLAGAMLLLTLLTTLPAVAQSHGVAEPTTAASETLYVPFVKGEAGVMTTQSYLGRITVRVRGIGQAAGTQWSDAFYIFTDHQGVPLPWEGGLPRPDSWTLWINGAPARYLVSPIPDYRPIHSYLFTMNAPGGRLRFAVGDLMVSDNRGAYFISIFR